MSPRLWESKYGKMPPTFGKMSHQGNEPPTLGKNERHRFWENQENQPPTLGKSASGKISERLPENQPPTTGKSATDFGEMSHQLWENELRRRMEIRNRVISKNIIK